MSEIYGRPSTGAGGGSGATARAGNGRDATGGAGDIAGTLSALEDKLRALEDELTTVEEEEARMSSPPPPGPPARPSRPSRAPRARSARPRSRAEPPAAGPASTARPAARGDREREVPAPGREVPAQTPSSGDLAEVVADARERLLALRGQVDDLLRFRDELRSSAQDLIADYQTVLDGGEAQETRVLLDVGPFAELATLVSFEQALAQIPEMRDVHVRSFQDGRAHLQLTLVRPMPLIERMRAVLDRRFRVTGAAPDSVTIELEPLPTGSATP